MGPAATELDNAPNAFLDYRLQVSFTHATTGRTYNVPGFFDGDGAGGSSGNAWVARFTPDEPGGWQYRASFRAGSAVAVSLDPAAGTATAFDGEAGTFTAALRDAAAPGFLKYGRLEYDAAGTPLSKHYYKFRDGPYFIKGGVDSPENFLGYAGF